ncbi:hypothetical protein [Actinomadura mexicana]|uniref:Mycothiol maleylpyruvate isomerase N-terminal domain-containing protein n=1 Tax=Actinomadura mexicana TaxID=134959 RepID=A0A239HMX1_9ACTN|nr:hypothetical protein [Actinomadura mexicana]SNS82736.1 hypothetical protein SAMN06265355_1332 [Actinomadura mexicana]
MISLAEITAATRALQATADRLDDDRDRAPSLPPGVDARGHVLTHLARGAGGGTRLLTWADQTVDRDQPGRHAGG